MLGIFLLYFIWKYYADLAFEYHKSRWGYGLLGIAAYYIGTFFGGGVLGIISVIIDSNFVNEMSNLAIGLMAVPFGLLAMWGLYKILQMQWRKETKYKDDLKQKISEIE